MMRSILIVIGFVAFSVPAMGQSVLKGKEFELYTNNPSSSVLSTYSFKTDKDVTLTIITRVFGTKYIDICPGKYKIDGNSIYTNCQCEDRTTFADPIVSYFTYNPTKKTLTDNKMLDADMRKIVYSEKSKTTIRTE